MENYRGFVIEPQFIYNDGLQDGIYYKKDDERAHSFRYTTIDEVKREIDNYYFDRINYRVVNERSITKFAFLDDAMRFINQFGGELETLVGNDRVEFDSL